MRQRCRHSVSTTRASLIPVQPSAGLVAFDNPRQPGLTSGNSSAKSGSVQPSGPPPSMARSWANASMTRRSSSGCQGRRGGVPSTYSKHRITHRTCDVVVHCPQQCGAGELTGQRVTDCGSLRGATDNHRLAIVAIRGGLDEYTSPIRQVETGRESRREANAR